MIKMRESKEIFTVYIKMLKQEAEVKVVIINGSPNKDGNTVYGLKLVADELKKENITVEWIHVGGTNVRGCLSCWKCAQTQSGTCVIKTDIVNESIKTMAEADGLLIGSPIYFEGVNGSLKSFLDRTFLVLGFASESKPLRLKVGASMVAVRRSGGINALNTLNKYLSISEMLIPTSNYWNQIYGMAPGDAEKDEEGCQAMQVLGKNMAYLLKMREATKDTIPEPELTPKVLTNFIR